MASLQQILESIKNASSVAPDNSEALMKKQAQNYDIEAIKQRIAANRAPVGNEISKDLDIRNPRDMELAKNIMRTRGVKDFEYETPAKVEYTEEPGGTTGAYIPALGETKKNKATPEQLLKLKEEAQAWFSPKEKQDEFAAALKAYKSAADSYDTSILDKVVSGETIDWSQLAKARPYLSDDQAKEAMQPWEEKVRQANAQGRLWSSQANKDEQRLNSVNKAHEDAINIVRKITPGLGDFNGSSYEKFRQSIRSSGMSYMTDKAQKEALKQRLKNDVAANVDPNNIFKNDTAAKQSEVQRLWKIIDEEYSK